jgi:hypothetical protein
MIPQSAFRIAFCLVALIFTAASAGAVDLTGTWTGKQSCDIYDGARSKVSFGEGIMQITQTGNQAVMKLSFGNALVTYLGRIFPDDRSPESRAEVTFALCGTSEQVTDDQTYYGELLRIRVTGTKFTGNSIFKDFTPQMGSCKWSYKKIDIVDPQLTGCP